MENWQLVAVVPGVGIRRGADPVIIMMALALHRAGKAAAEDRRAPEPDAGPGSRSSPNRVEVLSRGLKGGKPASRTS